MLRMTSLTRGAVLSALAAGCIGAAMGQGTFPGPELPPPPGTYISPDLFHILFANGIVIEDPSHARFTHSMPPPPPGGTQIHEFSSFLTCRVRLPDGSTVPANLQGNVVVRVHGLPPGEPSVRTFETEMLQMNLVGTVMGQIVRIRESPTLPSRGGIRMRELPAGFRIDSFFDVFTELSLDNGQSWIPAMNAGHVELSRGGCPGGDVNEDGTVDDVDLAMVLEAFGTNRPGPDVNADGIVDDTDLAIVLRDFGKSC